MGMYCCECDERRENCKCTFDDWNKGTPKKDGKYLTIYCENSADLVRKEQNFTIKERHYDKGSWGINYYHWDEDEDPESGVTLYWKELIEEPPKEE